MIFLILFTQKFHLFSPKFICFPQLKIIFKKGGRRGVEFFKKRIYSKHPLITIPEWEHTPLLPLVYRENDSEGTGQLNGSAGLDLSELDK